MASTSIENPETTTYECTTLASPPSGSDFIARMAADPRRRALMICGAPGVAAALAHRIVAARPPLTKAEWPVYERYLARMRQADLPVGKYPDGGLARPFRAPRYDIGYDEVLGDAERPGELGLAEGGMLFLDRLEDWSIASLAPILTAGSGVQLLASLTPCRCGGALRDSCTCSDADTRFQLAHRLARKYFHELVTVQLDAEALIAIDRAS